MKNTGWKKWAAFAGLILMLAAFCSPATADRLYPAVPAKYSAEPIRKPGKIPEANDAGELTAEIEREGELVTGNTIKIRAAASGGDGNYRYTLNVLTDDPYKANYLYYIRRIPDEDKNEENEWELKLYESGSYYFWIKAWDGNGLTYDNGYSLCRQVTGEDLAEKKAKEMAGRIMSAHEHDYDRALAAHDELIKKAVYDYTYVKHAASGVLMEGTGVCESYARAYYMLMKAMNIDVYYVTGTTQGGNHSWNKIRLNGKWYAVDCTWDDPGKVNGLENHLYFCLNDDILNLDHRQGEGNYPECVSMDDNYYIHSGFVSRWTDLLVNDGLNTKLTGGETEFSLLATSTAPMENDTFTNYYKTLPWNITEYVLNHEIWQGPEYRYRLSAAYDSGNSKMNIRVINTIFGDLKDATVLFDAENLPVYSGGEEVVPVYTVSLDGKMLTAGTDYDAAYGDNVNAGTATMTLTGKDSYEGEQALTFTIGPRPVDDAVISFEKEAYIYSGAAIEPEFTVKVGEWTLTRDTDYTVSFANNRDANREEAAAGVTITARENYTGEKTGKFMILPKELKITLTTAGKVYGDEEPELAWQQEGLAEGDQVTGAPVREAGENAGSYAVSPGTLSAGSNYDLILEDADFVIAPKELIITAKAAEKTYGETDPALEYEADGLVGEDRTDGAQTREEGENAGEYAISQGTLTAGDNYTIVYTGSKLTILPRELKITAKGAEKNYGESDPALEFEADGLTGEDRLEGSLLREEGENAGTYAITAGTMNAGSNYSVQFTGADFVIHPLQMKREWFSLAQDRFVETGKAKTPRVRLAEDWAAMKENDDFTVRYEKNLSAGDAKAIVTGKGNYEGTFELPFTVYPAGKAVCLLPAGMTEMEAESLSGTGFLELILPDGAIRLAADCLKGSSVLQIAVPNTDAAVDPEAFTGLEGITLISPAELKIGEETAAAFCEAKGFYFEESAQGTEQGGGNASGGNAEDGGETF